jgi:hypothetical protein
MKCSTIVQQIAHMTLNLSAPQIRNSLSDRMLQLRSHKKIPNVSARIVKRRPVVATYPANGVSIKLEGLPNS